MFRRVIQIVVALWCAGCARYAPLPLAQHPDLAAPRAETPSVKPTTVADVVAVALRRNPDLIAARTQKGVAQATLLQSGVLPDPGFSGAILPLLAGPGSTLAWNASLSGDIRSLVTLRVRRASSLAVAQQVDAQLLWQEWQTASHARLLALRIISGERLLAVQESALALFEDRDRRLRMALMQGNVTLQTAAPDIAALQTARAQVSDTERLQLGRRHELNAVLGREPDAPLALADRVDLPAIDLPTVDQLADATTKRRPDLIALRLGYRSQEAKTRLSVLMQFPIFTVGVTGGSDNSNVRSAGPQFSATLPIFDRNRGDIAVQRATRLQLRAEYQARLDAAYGQLRAAITELKAAQTQLAAVQADLPAVERAGAQAEHAFSLQAIDELAFVDLAGARFNKRQEIIILQQVVLEHEAGIAALTGAGLPSIENLPDVAL